MITLAIDTAGPVIGVALGVDGTMTSRVGRVQRGSEATLMPWVQELADQSGVALSELNAVVSSIGPGGFTALRVGLATAAGVALAASVPLVPVPSLWSRAFAQCGQSRPILSMLDARKGRVYAAWYGSDGEQVTEIVDQDPELLMTESGQFVATGEGAVVYASLVEASGGVVAENASDPCICSLLQLGERLLARGGGLAPEQVRPLYVRGPDAKPPRDLLMQRKRR